MRGLDLNQRPSGYEPDELPGCSTPRQLMSFYNAGRNAMQGKIYISLGESMQDCYLFFMGRVEYVHLVSQKSQGITNTYNLPLKF